MCPMIRASKRSPASKEQPKPGKQQVEHDNNVIAFLFYWRLFAIDVPEPLTEYHFAYPERGYRFDLAFPDQLLAIEIDGGQWMTRTTRDGRVIPVGRHTKTSDFVKMNVAAVRGWRVMHYSPEMVEDDPEGCVRQVVEALRHER